MNGDWDDVERHYKAKTSWQILKTEGDRLLRAYARLRFVTWVAMFLFLFATLISAIPSGLVILRFFSESTHHVSWLMWCLVFATVLGFVFFVKVSVPLAKHMNSISMEAIRAPD